MYISNAPEYDFNFYIKKFFTFYPMSEEDIETMKQRKLKGGGGLPPLTNTLHIDTGIFQAFLEEIARLEANPEEYHRQFSIFFKNYLDDNEIGTGRGAKYNVRILGLNNIKYLTLETLTAYLKLDERELEECYEGLFKVHPKYTREEDITPIETITPQASP